MKTVVGILTECWPRFTTLPSGITQEEYDAIRSGQSVELSDECADVLIERRIVKEEEV